MLMAGFPAHLLLRWLQWQSWAHYFGAFSFTLALVAGVLTIIEGNPAPPIPDESLSIFLTLGGDRWLALFMVWLPVVAVMATMFWDRAVVVKNVE